MRDKYDGAVSVQVHGVNLAAAVLDPHGGHLAPPDDVHRHVGIQVPVDRPPQPRPALDETGNPADHVVEPACRPGRIEPDRRLGSVVQQIQGFVGWTGPARPTRRAQQHRRGPGELDPDAEPSAGIRTSRSARPPAVRVWPPGHRGRSPDVRPVDANTRYGAPDQTSIGALSVLTTRTRTR